MSRLVGDQLQQNETKLARIEDAPTSPPAVAVACVAVPAMARPAKAAPPEMMPVGLFAPVTMAVLRMRVLRMVKRSHVLLSV